MEGWVATAVVVEGAGAACGLLLACAEQRGASASMETTIIASLEMLEDFIFLLTANRGVCVDVKRIQIEGIAC
jgi:hypothetical protein